MYRLLIADDEINVRKVINKLIDYDSLDLMCVAEYDNGDDLLLGISKEKPDIILIDMNMPGIHGDELIRKIREIDTAVECLIISGYNDFSYVKQAVISDVVNYILKPIDKEELNVSLALAIEKRSRYVESCQQLEEYKKNCFFESVVNGSIDYDNLKQLIDFTDKDLFIVGYVCSWFSCETNNSVSTYVKEYFLLKKIDNTLILHDPSENGNFLLVFKNIEAPNVNNLLKKIQKDLITTYETKTFISVSFIARPYFDLGKSFVEVKNEIENCTVNNKNVRNTVSLHYSSISKLKYQSTIDSLVTFLENTAAEMGDKYNCLTIYEVKNFQAVVLGAFKYILNNLGLEKELLDLLKIEKSLNNYIDLPIIIMIICRFAKQIDFKSGKNIKNKNDVIYSIKKYVDEHLNEKISLEELGNTFYLNKEYLSRLFKKTYGIGVFNYIDERKIEKSNEMLKDGKSVLEIVEALDFYDESHFYKKYKKVMGFNPMKYLG